MPRLGLGPSIYCPKMILGGGSVFTGLTFYVNTAASAGGDGTTNGVAGSTRAFASMREAVSSSNMHVSFPRRVLCSGLAADVLSVTQNDWDLIDTTPANYLLIQGDNTSGVWNTSAYRQQVSDTHCIYNNRPGHVRLVNLQGQITSNTSVGNNFNIFRLSTQNVGAGRTDCDCRIIGCFARGILVGTDPVTGYINSQYEQPNGGLIRLWNSIAWNCTQGFNSVFNQVANYNCTAFGSTISHFLDPQVCVNCIGAGATAANNFEYADPGGSDYNASTDASGKGVHAKINRTGGNAFQFIDSANGNFNLTGTDPAAKGFGVTDPASGLFSDNITGNTRSVPWNIGAW